MKFPLSWLQELIKTSQSPEKIANILTSLGIEVDAVHPVEPKDFVFDVSLTPNIGHVANIFGIARELSAVTSEKISYPDSHLKEEKELKIQDLISVKIENPEACPRYACRVLVDVKVKESPEWLKKRLLDSGFRVVNNVVDITNFVMLEMGQPLHAFDYDKLKGPQVVVRNAKPKEKIVTLDGKERFPTEETLLICDKENPITVAGVMGSAQSEVDFSTTRVLLESAYFEPSQVRRASKRLGLHTEASRRYERGCDPNAVLKALERASSLLQEIAHAKVASGVIDAGKKEFPLTKINLRLSRVNQLLGIALSANEVEGLLKRLGFEVNSSQSTFEVTVPSYRVDVKEEIDLVEEVARLYGYDNIFSQKKPLFSQESTVDHHPLFRYYQEIRRALMAQGLQEFLTCDLISSNQASLIAPDCMKSRDLVKLLNPSSADHAVLRPSLLPNMLQVIKYNQDHNIQTVHGFEVGKIHFKVKEAYVEPSVAAVVLTGKSETPYFDKVAKEVDFFDLKGILENLFAKMKVENVTFVPSNYANFHPGKQARILIDSQTVGIMGEIHPHTLKLADLKSSVFFAELDLVDIAKFVKKDLKMAPMPSFPASTRDCTLTLQESCMMSELLDAVYQQKSPLLEEVALLGIYRDEKVGTGFKNVTLRFVYRDIKETLSFEKVEATHRTLIENVITKLKSKIRMGS